MGGDHWASLAGVSDRPKKLPKIGKHQNGTWQVDPGSKPCGPYPGGLILTHTQICEKLRYLRVKYGNPTTPTRKLSFYWMAGSHQDWR